MFFRKKAIVSPYVEAGTNLRKRIVQALGLTGWERGDDPSYTPEEAVAIQRSMTTFQATANQTLGGEVVFHPDFFKSGFPRHIAFQALEDLNEDLMFGMNKLPENWKLRVSTYLKALSLRPNPLTLIRMADLLAMAGYKGGGERRLKHCDSRFFQAMRRSSIAATRVRPILFGNW